MEKNQALFSKIYRGENFLNTFTVFFINLFINHKSKKPTLIFLDNLDATPMEYLSDHFVENFTDALNNGQFLSRLSIFDSYDINFFKDYRIVFALRDANDKIINSHLKSGLVIKTIPFKLEITAEIYSEVVQKRIEFVKEIFKDYSFSETELTLRQLESVVDNILEDKYFKNAIITLFNYDYRTAISNIIDVITKYKPSTGSSYGDRGLLIYGLLQNLIENDFLKEYFQISVSKEDGYCFIDRVMLTVLMNLSEYSILNDEIEKQRSTDLYTLVTVLDKVYNTEDVLKSICRSYKYHEKDWVHLISLFNRNLYDKKDCEKDFYKNFDYLKLKTGTRTKRKWVKTKNKLSSTKIKINPAGYSYVRYILPHFEFYSNLQIQTEPLFFIKDDIDEKNLKYKFEPVIESVMKLVQLHLNAMNTYYSKKYKEHYPIDDFYASIFCFKYHGEGNHVPKQKGLFHSSRVITSHIDYIDNFRIYLTETSEKDNIKGINNKLLRYLEKYVEYLNESNDKYAIKRYALQFKRCIEYIRLTKKYEFRINRKNGDKLLGIK